MYLEVVDFREHWRIWQHVALRFRKSTSIELRSHANQDAGCWWVVSILQNTRQLVPAAVAADSEGAERGRAEGLVADRE